MDVNPLIKFQVATIIGTVKSTSDKNLNLNFAKISLSLGGGGGHLRTLDTFLV